MRREVDERKSQQSSLQDKLDSTLASSHHADNHPIKYKEKIHAENAH